MNAKVRDVMTPGPIAVDYHQSARAAPAQGVQADTSSEVTAVAD